MCHGQVSSKLYPAKVDIRVGLTEVETPHHLGKSLDREVGFDIVVGEVAKARHPHVGGDEDSDGVVDLCLVEIVVEHKHDLHPACERKV